MGKAYSSCGPWAQLFLFFGGRNGIKFLPLNDSTSDCWEGPVRKRVQWKVQEYLLVGLIVRYEPRERNRGAQPSRALVYQHSWWPPLLRLRQNPNRFFRSNGKHISDLPSSSSEHLAHIATEIAVASSELVDGDHRGFGMVTRKPRKEWRWQNRQLCRQQLSHVDTSCGDGSFSCRLANDAPCHVAA